MLVALALLIGIAAGSTASGTTKLRDDLRFAQEETNDLQLDVTRLSSDLKELKSQNDGLVAQVNALEQANAELSIELEAATARRPLPDLSGMIRDEVQAIADAYGWEVQFREKVSGKPKGTVISQTPLPGKTMRLGASLTVFLAKPPPPGWKDVKVWSGRGSLNTEEFTLSERFDYRVLYTFSGDTNTIIVLYQRPNEYVDLILNEIGDRSGQTRLYYVGRYYFEIEGGSWTVKLQVYK